MLRDTPTFLWLPEICVPSPVDHSEQQGIGTLPQSQHGFRTPCKAERFSPACEASHSHQHGKQFGLSACHVWLLAAPWINCLTVARHGRSVIWRLLLVAAAIYTRPARPCAAPEDHSQAPPA